MANLEKNSGNINPAPVHIEDTNDFEKSLVFRAKYTGYKNLFQSVYEASGLFMIVALAFSAMLSAKFFASFLAFAGDSAIFVGGIIACGVSYFIYDLHTKAIKYKSAQKRNEPVLNTLLWGLVALSVYADLSGGAEWGADFTGAAPTDAKTTELGGIYTPQIEAINKEIDEIEAKNFYWCGTHNKAHKCEKANFYIEPADKKHVQKIEELKAHRTELQNTMNGLLADAGKAHSQSTAQHYEKLERNQGALRGAGVFAVVVALLIGHWRHQYEERAVAEIEARRQAAANRYQHPESEMPKAEAALDIWAEENRKLREERDALKESIADKESRLASEIEALKRAQAGAERKRLGRARSFNAGAKRVWNFVAGASSGNDAGTSAGAEKKPAKKSEEERYSDLVADIKAGIRDPRELMSKHKVNVNTVNEAVRLHGEEYQQAILF